MGKYTVIIPTRDRAETLEATLRTCIRQDYDNFEIIVSDNCSDDDTRDIVASFKDSRIKYLHTGHRLSMSGNFEFSLRHATDGFVMFLGSDDGLMPDAVNYVDAIVKEYGVDAVSCQQATYVWPGFPDKSIAGRLVFDSISDDVEIRSSEEWIRKALSFESFFCFDLPNIYCGFVHRRVINKGINNNKYFQSITPDAYGAYVSAVFLDRYAYSHRPFSIAGASHKSNGAAALNPAGDKSEAEKFLRENDIPLAVGFVNCPSYEVASAEAFAKVAETFPVECKNYKIDYKKMLQMTYLNKNKKTESDVVFAVNKMAENFGVNIDDIKVKSVLKNGLKINRIFQIILSIIKHKNKFISVINSEKYSVKDVDDAALFAHALRASKLNKRDFTTVGDVYINRIRQLF